MPQLILIVPVLAMLWDRGANHPAATLPQVAPAVLYWQFARPYPETITLISTEVLKP